jgi:hypothetical protein
MGDIGPIFGHYGMTVSGWTNVNDSRQSAQYRNRKTQRARSRFVNLGLFVFRFRTSS